MTIESLIKAGKYDWVNDNISTQNFPDEPKPVKGIQIITLKKDITSEEAIEELKKQGLRPATLTELLIYGKEHPKEPVLENGEPYKYIVALSSVWQDRVGRRRVPYLDRLDSRRLLDLGWFDVGWDASCRFAAVPASTELSPQNTENSVLSSFDPSSLEITYQGKKYRLEEV